MSESAVVPPLSTSLVTDVDAFAALEYEWDALLENSAQHVFFLRWYWNWLWWQRLAPPGSRLHVICCRDASGRLVGVAPLYEASRTILGLPWVREVAMLGTGIELKTAEYMDAFALRGAETEVGRVLAAALHASSSWDRASFVRVPAESAVMPHLLGALEGRVSSASCDRAPYIDTAGSWQDYKHGLGRSMRRNVEYYSRRLARERDCEFRLVTAPDEFDEAFDHLVRLHQARWTSVNEPGTFRLPVVREFLRESMRRCHGEGRLRLWTLRLDGVVEAALVGFIDRGVFHYFQKGFNPSFLKDGLGNAILSLSLRACFEDSGIAAFDFMGGGAEYKTLWARQERVTMLHEVSRPTMTARAFEWYVRSRETCAGFYRSMVPVTVRVWRREWLRKRRNRMTSDVDHLACAIWCWRLGLDLEGLLVEWLA